ncbi:hypothetical protein [Methanogenium cariaci]|uniref:hypothetical protein n=1 Tax=Methanogenium cariaci TaxID=2197 RepID=UPI0012F67464|nr:hypothetical protein [Methanogenium cariaci]
MHYVTNTSATTEGHQGQCRNEQAGSGWEELRLIAKEPPGPLTGFVESVVSLERYISPCGCPVPQRGGSDTGEWTL